MKRGIKSSTHLSAKGQVVIPKAIRDAGGWRAGLELEVEATEDGVVLRPRSLGRARAAESLLGCTGYQGPTRSLAEMDAAVKREAKARR
ncbi:MAG TPA: AbrB/MazE/SpoVT family DNA-binding domain-containing protein [Polyangiaceae bacterium]|jgi:AbrB family looped-hinge helix DNA binding protein|nr:AbrB/MazE/SpoVT family DNA-binding domain-containing protein [Polyangiaceae bacterium]